MSTALLSNKKVTLSRNDTWSLKPNPYSSELNNKKIQEVGMDQLEFDELGKKLGRCTNKVHIKNMWIIFFIMSIVPIICLIKARGIIIVFAISTGICLLIIISIIIATYFRYHPIMYKRAFTLIQAENK